MVSPIVDQKLTFSFLFLSHLQTVEILLRILPLAGGILSLWLLSLGSGSHCLFHS